MAEMTNTVVKKKNLKNYDEFKVFIKSILDIIWKNCSTGKINLFMLNN